MTIAAQAMTERQLQDAVIACAKLLGWRVYHTHDSRRSEPGFPDLVMVRNGRVIFAELKREHTRTSPAQDAWLSELALVEDDAVEVHVWRPWQWLDGSIERILL